MTQSLKSFSVAMDTASESNKQFRKAEADTMNDLIAGRVACLGRRVNAYEFEHIDPSFWIGSTIKWHTDAVVRGDEQFIDVRVTDTQLTASVQPKAHKGPGRPSKADVIEAAIAHYATGDRTLSRPPALRHRAYLSYISEHGYEPRKESGFNGKTLEKYEKKFRERNS